MKNILDRYKNELKELHDISCERKIVSIQKYGKYIVEENKKYLNLSSNDYLGIAESKKYISRFYKIGNYSLGAASSRLLTGGSYAHVKLECLLAAIFGKDKALIFNSGYHANVGIMSSLLGKKDAVFCDKLNHASILDGIKLSGSKMFRYKHLDYEHLEELLRKHRNEYDNAIIVSESLFSMDGDITDLSKLIELKEKYNALLVVDEAHAFGVYGQKGLGLCEEKHCINDVDVIVATFGKSIGSVGAFCVASDVIINYLVNKSRPMIFSTALPEINIAFSYYVLTEVLPNYREERKQLLNIASKLRTNLEAAGLETRGESHIVPVILGSNDCAMKVSKHLIDNGYYLLPIRHPTVAENSARIRISLRADISYEEVEKIPELIKEVLN